MNTLHCGQTSPLHEVALFYMEGGVDVLQQDGLRVTKLPLLERKKLLANIVRNKSLIAKTQFIEGYGGDYFDAVKAQDLEGIVLFTTKED